MVRFSLRLDRQRILGFILCFAFAAISLANEVSVVVSTNAGLTYHQQNDSGKLKFHDFHSRNEFTVYLWKSQNMAASVASTSTYDLDIPRDMTPPRPNPSDHSVKFLFCQG